MKNAPVRHAFEYGLFLAVRGAIRALPHGTSRHLGSALGALTWGLLGSRRQVALDNLRLALGELDPDERRKIARRSFLHLGRVTCDTVSSHRFDAVEVCSRLTLEGFEHLEAARSAGRGVLVMSAHLGSWEMAAHPVGLYAEPMHVIGRPLDNPLLDTLLQSQRRRFGNEGIPKRGAARGSMRVLRRGGIVGILIDQRVKQAEGIPVPFFGHPAVTSPLLGRLVLRTGSPVVPLFGHLEPAGRYRVEFLPPVDTDVEGEGAVEEITRRCLAVVEAQIRRRPESWLWLHRRWKRS